MYTMKKVVAWNYIHTLIKDNKIDIKSFCRRKHISYGNFARILREETDMKVSTMLLIAEMLKIEDLNELFREER